MVFLPVSYFLLVFALVIHMKEKMVLLFFFFFFRHYNFREVLAFSRNVFHLGRFLMQSLKLAIFIFVISLFTSSSHLFKWCYYLLECYNPKKNYFWKFLMPWYSMTWLAQSSSKVNGCLIEEWGFDSGQGRKKFSYLCSFKPSSLAHPASCPVSTSACFPLPNVTSTWCQG
jgi:hypothetical protein